MTAAAIAAQLHARRTGPGRWVARCPSHEDRTPSLDIATGDDGRTLLLCRAGCDTADVIRAAGLEWSDLFPSQASSHYHRHHHGHVDPQVAIQCRDERRLQEWAEQTGRLLRDDLYLRNQLLTLAERRLAVNREDARGWDLLAHAYLNYDLDEWLLGFLDSRRPEDWQAAREYLRGEL